MGILTLSSGPVGTGICVHSTELDRQNSLLILITDNSRKTQKYSLASFNKLRNFDKTMEHASRTQVLA